MLYEVITVETDGRVVQPEGTSRHQAVEEHAGLIIELGRHVAIRERRAEHVVDFGRLVQHGVGVDAGIAVQQHHDERDEAVV